MVRSTLLHFSDEAGPTGKSEGFNISRDIDRVFLPKPGIFAAHLRKWEAESENHS